MTKRLYKMAYTGPFRLLSDGVLMAARLDRLVVRAQERVATSRLVTGTLANYSMLYIR